MALLATTEAARAQAPMPGNGLELDYRTFAELQALVASQDSVRVQGSFGSDRARFHGRGRAHWRPDWRATQEVAHRV